MHWLHTYQNLPETFYSKVLPNKIGNATLLIYNDDLATQLAIDWSKQEALEYLSGNKVLSELPPIAQAYAGHQFGHFNMLGDGRAILLGELSVSALGLMDVQLKGAGKTPYSRGGDGKMALSSALREYVYSECMYLLGINTSRSLAVVSSSDKVYRQTIESAAVLTRISNSHIRFGTFEYAAKFGTIADVEALLDYTINRHYPALLDSPNKALAFLEKILQLHMQLVVDWMRVGFIHGVLNTDNMSITAQTFDYGPCAFMNAFNPSTVYSQIDTNGRYAFGQQANIVHWNCIRLAESLLTLIHPNQAEAIKLATAVLDNGSVLFDTYFNNMMHRKCGFEKRTEKSMAWIGKLMQWMQNNKADYTNTFLHIMQKDLTKAALYETEEWQTLMLERQHLIIEQGIDNTDSYNIMQAVNPNYIPRNRVVENLINNAVLSNNMDAINTYLDIIHNVYDKQIAYPEMCDWQEDIGFKTHCNT